MPPHRVLAIALVTFSTGCANPVIEASVTLNDESVLSVELDPIHPYLAEYDRTAVLRNPGASPVRQKLFLDTGGYTASNLFRCGRSLFMLKGYFDSWLIDTSARTIQKGECESQEYIGVFDGVERWEFYPAAERAQRELIPSGG